VLAENAYITNLVSANVSVIDTATNTVIATIPVGIGQTGVAVTPDGSKVYVALANVPFVSVIDTATNTVIATIPVGGLSPFGVAVTPDGSKVYVTDSSRFGHVSVIDTTTNTVIAAIPVGEGPRGVAVTPDGSKVYVTNVLVQLPTPHPVVSVIDTTTNTVIATIPLGGESNGVAVTPDGRKVYVANSGSNNVFVIDTATNAVIAVVSVGIQPVAFGAFIRQPAPFAGTPREPGCHGKSVSALAEQFGGLPAAATARGFSSVPALQDAINVFCRGGAAAAG
jgi:YVTN family beta-propeller protein